jgi:peptide/nickel transport system substrate-binding protein
MIAVATSSTVGLKYAVLKTRHFFFLLLLLTPACRSSADRRGATVLFASGADLQSINPLLTVHPLARQVQRYVLLTTLARYDSTLTPRPYLARNWEWTPDRRRLTFHLQTAVRWHDGRPTTGRDVVWTLEAARDPATGYPRSNELAALEAAAAPDDSTVVLRFRVPQPVFPDLLTDLAILPAHLLDTVPHARLRQAAWNQRPVGNGPFRFVSHEPNRRWVFAADTSFPQALGAGIQPAHAEFVRRDPALEVLSYPLLMTYGIVFNTRRAPFNDPAVRRLLSDAIDRKELVEGYIYGFGTPAVGPVPPAAPDYLPIATISRDLQLPAKSGRRLSFELLTVGSGEAALEQMVQARLRNAGFDLTIRQLELSAFLARVYGPAHDFDAAVLGVPGDLGLGYLAPLAALAGLRVPEDRAAAQRMFADSLPVAFLYHARGLQGVNRRVRGVTMDLRGELPTVHDWWVARER